MNKHTPGPWEPLILDKPLADIPAYVERCISTSGGDDFYFVGGWNERCEQVDVCHVGNGPRGLENARLIAAAPEMLAALRAIEAETVEGGRINALARAAIARAEGGAA